MRASLFHSSPVSADYRTGCTVILLVPNARTAQTQSVLHFLYNTFDTDGIVSTHIGADKGLIFTVGVQSKGKMEATECADNSVTRAFQLRIRNWHSIPQETSTSSCAFPFHCQDGEGDTLVITDRIMYYSLYYHIVFHAML